MASFVPRRVFLKSAVASVAATALPSITRAATFTVTDLGQSLSLVSGAGANVVAVQGRDGLALIDGGIASQSDALLRFIAGTISPKPIRTLFNTHWHPEQTGSNERLGQAGAKIVAQENTRLWLRTDAPLPESETTYGPLPVKACPNDTFYTTSSSMLDDRQVDCGYLLQAHTDGDMYVFFPDANVLVAGGAVSGDRWPIIDWRTGGWIGGMVNGLKTLLALVDNNTKIVPADGPALSRAELQSQQEMYATILGRLQKMLRQGHSPQEAVEAKPAKEFKPDWGDSDPFVAMAFKSLWGHFAPDA